MSNNEALISLEERMDQRLYAFGYTTSLRHWDISVKKPAFNFPCRRAVGLTTPQSGFPLTASQSALRALLATCHVALASLGPVSPLLRAVNPRLRGVVPALRWRC